MGARVRCIIGELMSTRTITLQLLQAFTGIPPIICTGFHCTIGFLTIFSHVREFLQFVELFGQLRLPFPQLVDCMLFSVQFLLWPLPGNLFRRTDNYNPRTTSASLDMISML